jgi:hypothetical protein
VRMPSLRTFILAGGLGMGLLPVSGLRPIAIMPVGGQPFLELLIEGLAWLCSSPPSPGIGGPGLSRKIN